MNPILKKSRLFKAFIFEIFYVFISIINSSFFWISFDPKEAKKLLNGSRRNTPILLIHGYLHNQTAWFWFRYKLSRAKFTSIYTLNLFHSTSSIHELAKIIQKKVTYIQAQTGIQSVNLIGHSLGGIIASYYREYLASSPETNQVILLGSPVRGTELASLAIGKIGKALMPDSFFLFELNKRMIHSSNTHYYYIGSEADNLIIPSKSAFPSKGIQCSEDAFIIDDLGHMGLLYSSKVINKVITWLDITENK